MEGDKPCTFGLSLGLGIGGYVPKKEKQKVHKHVPCMDLTFDLYPKGEAIDVNHDDHKVKEFNLKRINDEEYQDPNSKSDDNMTNNKNGSRKKLRLTKEQSAMLENSFNMHNTLSPAQKHALAEKLNLKHRQVEVWFQNRRARTKLKQTEVDCESLKKCCEKLTNENLRLKKELQELCALKVRLSQVATMTTCSSCKELLKPNEGNNVVICDVVHNNNNHKFQSSIEL
ncbi:hypothetical protein TanjilG_16710 [Lupinus angustifolius]|uniref:Homeobox domain-containing protein n=1 Tax=Lupinus angustifolius TaxID=3871 RepID=A0A4P1QZI0_LUPAN|nr:PREDICTED: homeobox-leucine zipper protein HAT22-like [Lupinus angustifolius]OIV98383.1 hypothetical protein TanjilG_16710 [Lupinus angustifolius]